MSEELRIISLTSFPPRINGVSRVVYSVLRCPEITEFDKCILVLSEEEFPNKENDLPSDLNKLIDSGLLELIWDKGNIRSHKKLMPILEKYPDATVLIIDDDVIRPKNFLKAFLEDHKKYPNDIIAGRMNVYLSDSKFVRYKNPQKRCLDYGHIIKNGRPANGCGGTLYPAHTFTDKRFFDRKLFMELSPTSDESWQFYFNMLENRNIRLISTPLKEIFIEGSQQQKTALYRTNRNKYDNIYNLLKNTIK